MSSMSLFFTIDLFRHPMQLLFNSESKRTSNIGLLLSIGIYIFCVYSFFQSNMYLKQSPFVITQTLTGTTTNPIQFTNQTELTFQISDSYGKFFYDPSIFFLTIRKFHQKIINGSNLLLDYKEEPLIPCIDPNNRTDISYCVKNNSLFVSGYVNEFEYSYFNINVFLCDNKTTNGTCKTQKEIDMFFLDRRFFSANIHGAEVDVNDYHTPLKKKNNAFFYLIDPKICKRNYFYLKKIKLSSDEGWIFNDITEFSEFKVDYTTMDFNTREEKQPLYQFLFFASYNYEEISRRYQTLPELLGSFAGTAQFLMIFCFLATEIFIYIDSMRKILNSLYVFPTIKTNKKKKEKEKKFSLKFNLKTQKSSELNLKEKQNFEKSNKIYEIEMKPNNETEINNKKEEIKDSICSTTKKKSDDIIHINSKNSSINHFSKSESYINIKIPKKILDDDSFHLENYSKNDIKQITIKNKEIKSKLTHSPRSKLKNNIKTIKNQISSILKKKENPESLKIGIFEYLKTKTKLFFKSKLNEKQELINKAENLYKNELDIVPILKKLQEIDKIKLLIMNDDQLTLFELLAKPMCCISNEKTNSSPSWNMNERIKNYKTHKNKEDIILSYDKIVVKAKEDEFSKRLLKLVDKSIIDLKNE